MNKQNYLHHKEVVTLCKLDNIFYHYFTQVLDLIAIVHPLNCVYNMLFYSVLKAIFQRNGKSNIVVLTDISIIVGMIRRVLNLSSVIVYKDDRSLSFSNNQIFA